MAKPYVIKNPGNTYGYDFKRYVISQANKVAKSKREYTIENCKHTGGLCLITYMKYYSHQNYCQKCEMELGLIKTESEHFARSAQGKFRKGQSGNKNGCQRYTLKHKLKLRLAKITPKD